MKAENEIDLLLTPESEVLSFKIPPEWIGRKLKVIAFTMEDENTEEEASDSNDSTDIPQWHQDLVLAEKRRVEQDPSLLISLETIKQKFQSHF